ncbi:tRNA lysidine(34) synthetase TilS [Niveibacterium umoris]|uniref:tRNA(Ile)-lysidine synthase n=1 Tax=Niveibacterium umoris TaxID=1193620 RepID=A0A840BH38_9RHOO|nr:tRNA lysidine(34) synthetase TilS [Niveibacterium umoris]MBB4012515.1 tRNA(Ile)-lysidine synthase [Niveibacterium umoris]
MPEPSAPDATGAELLEQRLRDTLAGATRPGQILTVAFSGGLDSTVLLHLLTRAAPALGLRLRAAHVHHGLQAQADAWAAHCAKACGTLGVPCEILHVSVDRSSGLGLEAAARSARHAALRALGGDWLVLAHHRGDQAETLLHRLTRGAGVHGAAAMRGVDARRGPPALLRPLLDEPRAALLAWAQQNRLQWIEDPSNQDTHFRRNFLRHEVLAPLTARLPQAEAGLARAASHFHEAAGLLDALAAIDHAAVECSRGASLAALLALNDARLKNLLRARIAVLGHAAPDARQLAEALRQLRTVQQPWRAIFGQWALCADAGLVWFEAAEVPLPGVATIWQGEPALHWGDVMVCFEPASAPDALAFRPGELELVARSGGERIRPDAARPARDIKTLARDSAIPPWWRAAMPVFKQAGRVIGWGEIGDVSAHGSDGWRIRIAPPNAKF